MKATSEELERMRDVFKQLDVNKDGRLSFEEVKNGIDKITGSASRYSKSEYF